MHWTQGTHCGVSALISRWASMESRCTQGLHTKARQERTECLCKTGNLGFHCLRNSALFRHLLWRMGGGTVCVDERRQSCQGFMPKHTIWCKCRHSHLETLANDVKYVCFSIAKRIGLGLRSDVGKLGKQWAGWAARKAAGPASRTPFVQSCSKDHAAVHVSVTLWGWRTA